MSISDQTIADAGKELHFLSICDIGIITFHLMMAKYLAMLPRGKMVW